MMRTHLWFPKLLSRLSLLLALGVICFSGVVNVSAEEENLSFGYFETEISDIDLNDESTDLMGSGLILAYLTEEAAGAAAKVDVEEQDPWEPFNETMFNFNREILDRFLLKPIATAWDFVLPDPAQRSLRNLVDNLDFTRRFLNNLLQAKLGGAGREIARFTINSTVGVVGLFDVAKDGFGIEQSDEDTGQTFAVWGMGPGPYLVLPFLPVTTVRDGIGGIFDAAMQPLNYVFPIVVGVGAISLGVAATDAVNQRSLHLATFEGIEETVVDLYSAVRNAYLQRRAAAIKE